VFFLRWWRNPLGRLAECLRCVAFWRRVEVGGLRVEREDVAMDELGGLKS
jgi:hypothetical protein